MYWPQGGVCQCSVPYLHAGCSYQVRVRAQNSMGWGPFSETLSLTARPGPPQPPSAPRCAKRKADALEMEWDAPASNGGAAVAAYRLEMAGEPLCMLTGVASLRQYCMTHAAGWVAFCASDGVWCLQCMSADVPELQCAAKLAWLQSALHACPPTIAEAVSQGMQELYVAAYRRQPFLHGISCCSAAAEASI